MPIGCDDVRPFNSIPAPLTRGRREGSLKNCGRRRIPMNLPARRGLEQRHVDDSGCGCWFGPAEGLGGGPDLI
jgi:hypothetical protein